MAKKQKSANKTRANADKLVKKVSGEFDKTSSQIERMVSDALKKIEKLQKQIQEPVKKLMDDADKLRDREIKRLQGEFDKRVKELQTLQQSVMQRVGIADKKKPAGKKTAAASKPSAKASSAVKSATKPAAKAVKKATGQPAAKPAAKKAPAKPATGHPSDLTRIKGVGPATAEKMRAKGIKEISQVANPSAEDNEKLAEFAKLKSFASWQAEAKKLV